MAVLRFFFIPLILFFQSPIFSAALPKPRLEWEFKAESNLYAPPLVADFHPNLGQEVVFSDTEARKLVCLSATGEMIWEYDGGWTKRLISGASLSFNAVKEGAAILIGNPDGTLHCLDARSGQKLWATQVGEISWTNAIWADVDGDGRDEAVAATRQQGITCLRSDGSVLWKYPKGESSRPSRISSTISAADVDGDGASEVFFCSLDGPVALDGNGDLLWETPLGDYYLGSLVLGDTDSNGSPEVYSCSVDESALVAFDSRTGERIWRAQMRESEHSTSGSSLALGDLDFDGQQEILVGDETGAITCFDCRGGFQWLYQGTPKTRAALSLGDVDGDGDIEILAASGDRTLTCLDSRGNLEWSWETDRRLLAPATLTDLDEDGRTEIVFGSCDRLLRVLTLEGRYDKDLIPWPTARYDSPQSGSSFGVSTYRRPRLIERKKISLRSVGLNTQDGSHRVWISPGVRNKNNRPPPRRRVGGFSKVRLTGGPWTRSWFGKGSTPFESDREQTPSFLPPRSSRSPGRLSAIQSEIFYHGPGFPKATLCWWNDRGIVREDEFNLAKSIPSDASDTWVRLSADQVKPPLDANRFQLVCSNPMNASGAASWWDGGSLIGRFREPAKVESLVNQVGYDIGAPKRFTVQSNFLGEQAVFEILSVTGESVFAGELGMAGKISGAYGNDWGSFYYRGDFTEFDRPGKFRIQVQLDEELSLSWPFEVGEDLIWEQTARPAYEFFYYQRCGMEVPGFHKACHLDDSIDPGTGEQFDLAGGWHDAGDYNKYHNAPYIYGLAKAYENLKKSYDPHDADSNDRSDFLDEILWGGDFSRRMLAPDGSARGRITSGYGFWGGPEQETDNLPGTGDERPLEGGASGLDSSHHTAAMAKIALLIEDRESYLEAAKRGFEWGRTKGLKGPLQLSSALDLYELTGKEEYAEIAQEILPKVGLGDPFLIEKYDRLFGEDHSEEVKKALIAEVEGILTHADNPFGVYTYGDASNPNFFNTPAEKNIWHLGTTDHLLVAADRVALAYRYQPDPRYLQFIYDQINWTLGNNPFDTSLMEGSGSQFVPTYHQRLIYGGVERGAVPGGIINGISWRAPGDDRPKLDLSGVDIPAFESNEVWLPHNTYYLKLLSNLQRSTE